MAVDDKRVAKLEAVLERLRGGKNVQNRQLQALLGEAAYAQFEDEWRQQQELRVTLAEKPKEVLEYERRLKEATFAYGKADAASGQGRYKAARSLLATSDTKFERLAEYLAEHIAGKAHLEVWFDRSVHFDASNTPNGSAEKFPCVITSRSLRNRGGGLLNVRRTKQQIKLDAVERELERLTTDAVEEADLAKVMAARQKLLKRAAD